MIQARFASCLSRGHEEMIMNGNVDILAGITAAEREIQERIDAERRAAAEGLESLRRRVAEELAGEESRLAAELDAALEASREEGERKAAAIVSSAKAQAARLASLTDETLTRAVLEHLPRILPEGTP